MRALQNIYALTFLLLIPVFSRAQQNTANSRPAYTYRSVDNPDYWGNRKPDGAYWQQDVEYTIRANVDVTTDIVSGSLTLTYYNNSPDSLPFVYFHVYQEAFQPDSYVDALNKANHVDPTYGKYEAEGHGTDVEKIYIRSIDGFPVNMEAALTYDFSVIKAVLPAPIKPGGKITFYIPFNTYFDKGSLRRRMKMFPSGDFKQYDGVHWYPRICVYDRKSGWNTDQHLGKEFYGDYGSYDVQLTIASNYILDATGVLENEKEVLPDTLRRKLDIRNFAGKPWEEAPSVIIPYVEGQTKTWKYFAMNVHDFAWTADPNYRIGEATAYINGKAIRCVALAQEGHAGFWQNAASYTARVIETYSRDFGAYMWPKIIVADSRDGMEYPMLTLDGGYDPSYRDLFAHEVGHMWFFGMVGNNETYRASLDEGFTQFLTAWGYRHIDGDTRINFPETNKYVAKYRKPDEIMYSEVYYAYLADAITNNDATLNTHSDMYNSALGHGGGYRHVYFKTAVMLYDLQYVLGDDLFLQAMQHYFDQWRLCHPYMEDFRNSIINYTHVDLNWFFDQWIETTKHIDYSIQKVDKTGTTDLDGQTLYQYDVTFERKGQMQMPIDFIVVNEHNDTLRYYIPNTWFNKYENAADDMPQGRLDRTYFEQVISLPKWFGWDLLNPTYTAQITTTAPIEKVQIDPSYLMADVDLTNNSWKCPVTLSFDSKINNYPDRYHYEMFWRPDIWGNAYDGLKLGAHLEGNYMDTKNIFSLTVWGNTGIGQGLLYEPSFDEMLADDILIDKSDDFDKVNYNFSYRTATEHFLHNSDFFLESRYLDGVFGFKTGFDLQFGRNNRNKLSAYVNDLYINKHVYLYNYNLIENGWNNAVHVDFKHGYDYGKGKGKLSFAFRSNDLFSEYDYTAFSLEAVNKTQLGKFDLHTRYFIQAGSGSNVPFESALLLAGGNTEDMLDDKFLRSRGFFPDAWAAYGNTIGHLHTGGGLNLRGYTAYLAAEEDADGNVYTSYAGVSGTSASVELQFNGLFDFHVIKACKMEPYIFGDAGIISTTQDLSEISSLRADAGIGAMFTWSWFGPLESVKPITLRVDLPLFLNRPPFDEPDYFAFRYVIGIKRAF
ncbi:MAG: M1 family metallopeptidase [Chitinophagales bacterium]